MFKLRHLHCEYAEIHVPSSFGFDELLFNTIASYFFALNFCSLGYPKKYAIIGLQTWSAWVD